jgi:hypothetical protein
MSKATIHRLPRRSGGCPVCGKPPTAAAEPFCSARCRDVDLSRWFSGSYAIPAVEAEDEGAEDRDVPEDQS